MDIKEIIVNLRRIAKYLLLKTLTIVAMLLPFGVLFHFLAHSL